jgi:O-antigen ligase
MSTTHGFEYGASRPGRNLARLMARVAIFGLLCLSITAPAITITESLPWVKAEQLLLPLVVLLYGWMLLSGSARLIRLNGMFVIGALYCFSILLSIWYGAAILHHEILFRDYYELPKVWLPVIFFTIAYESNLSESSLRRLFNYFAPTVLLICFYAWAQFARLNFTYKLNTFYSGGAHIDEGLLNHGRVYSTMGNANVLGQLMTWSIVAFTMAFLFGVGSRVRNIAITFACLVTLAMTGSRYGLFTTAIGLALIFAMPSSFARRRFAQLALLIVLLPAFVWAFEATVNTNQGNVQRIQSLRHPLEVDSLRARLDDLWLDAADDFLRSPFLGYGPAKIFYTGVFTDSEYLDVLKEFGIIGFFPYLAYYFFPMLLLWRGLRASRQAGAASEERFPATFLTVRFAFILAVTALVMNVGESTFYNQLLQAFLWLWLGLGASCARRIAAASAAFRLQHEGHEWNLQRIPREVA